MRRSAASVSSRSHGVAMRAWSPKSDAKRSSSGGQADASARAGHRRHEHPRVEDDGVAQPRELGRSARPARSGAMSAARTDRGGRAGVARRAHAALLDQAADAAGGLGLELLPGAQPAPVRPPPARRAGRGSPRRSARGAAPRAAGRPGSRAISRKPRTDAVRAAACPAGAWPGAAAPGRAWCRRRTAPTAPRRGRATRSPPRSAVAAPRCRSRSPSSASSARVEVAGHDERIGAEAVVGDDLAGDRREQVVERVVGDEAERPAAGVADRVERSIGRRRARAARAAAVNQRPQWNGSPGSGAASGSGATAAPEAAEATGEVGRQESLPLGGDGGVGAERLALGRAS